MEQVEKISEVVADIFPKFNVPMSQLVEVEEILPHITTRVYINPSMIVFLYPDAHSVKLADDSVLKLSDDSINMLVNMFSIGKFLGVNNE